MMEFYQAYATYEDLMNFTEELLMFVARELFRFFDVYLSGDGDRLDSPLAETDGERGHSKIQGFRSFGSRRS